MQAEATSNCQPLSIGGAPGPANCVSLRSLDPEAHLAERHFTVCMVCGKVANAFKMGVCGFIGSGSSRDGDDFDPNHVMASSCLCFLMRFTSIP
jgi:hypothetical protein